MSFILKDTRRKTINAEQLYYIYVLMKPQADEQKLPQAVSRRIDTNRQGGKRQLELPTWKS